MWTTMPGIKWFIDWLTDWLIHNEDRWSETALLSDARVKVFKCTKLKAKPSSKWTTAAFYVLCDEASFTVNLYGLTVELRDWYFR